MDRNSLCENIYSWYFKKYSLVIITDETNVVKYYSPVTCREYTCDGKRENEKYESFNRKNNLSIDPVWRCKLNPLERDVNSRVNSFISREEFEVYVWPARKWTPFLLFVFLLVSKSENWVVGTVFVTIAYNFQTWKLHLSLLDPRSIYACQTKKTIVLIFHISEICLTLINFHITSIYSIHKIRCE